MSDRLTVTQIAAEYGIKPSTFRAYVKRGQAPPADGHHDGRTPYWLRETLEAWRGQHRENAPAATDATRATTPSERGNHEQGYR